DTFSKSRKKGVKNALVKIVNLIFGYCSVNDLITGMVIATSPIAERRMTSMCLGCFGIIWMSLTEVPTCAGTDLFLSSQYRIQLIIVIHFHLLIHFHVFIAMLNINEQVINGFAQIITLFQQHIELSGAIEFMG